MGAQNDIEPASVADAGTSNEEISRVTSARDLDDTYHVFKNTEDLNVTENEAKHVLRKIDRRIVPILL
jgi:hypothetical protein